MSYEVRLSRDAASYLRRLDPATRERIEQRLLQLTIEPYSPIATKPLTGPPKTAIRPSWRLSDCLRGR